MKPYGVPRKVVPEYNDPWDHAHYGHGDMKSRIKHEIRRYYKKSYRAKCKAEMMEDIFV